jgi:hypothetical protein
MTDVFDMWPFIPVDKLSEDLQKRWWAECFLPNQAYEILKNQPHWAMIVGDYGSGKTTLLKALHIARKAEGNFVLDYTEAWQKHSQANCASIFSNIMSLAAQKLYYGFKDQPDLLSNLRPTHKEFLRWLVEKFISTRAYRVFVDNLDTDLFNLVSDVLFSDLYPTQTEISDVEGQISELVALVNNIGYKDVLVFIDSPSFPSEIQLTALTDFLGWLEPMHHKGFVVISALSKPFFEASNLETNMRDRVRIIPLQLPDDVSYGIAARYISAATGNKVKGLKRIISKDLLEKIEQMLKDEFGSITPGPLVNIAEIVLSIKEKNKTPEVLDESLFEFIRSDFFLRHVPLRLDEYLEQKGVWRGRHFIHLDTGSYDLLTRLFKSKVLEWGRNVKPDYLHTLASRLRKAIEPDPANPVYVKNQRGEGYWLEGITKRSNF